MSYGREFSSSTLKAAEASQRIEDLPLLGGAYKAIRDYIAGSDSPAYEQARWQKADHTNLRTWPIGSANPEAGYLPRTWNRVIILGIAKTALLETFIDLPKSVEPAVAYRYRSTIHVGVLPNGFGELLGDDNNENSDLYAVATRQGRRPIVATMGLWWPETRGLVVPDGVEIVDELVPTVELAERYPGVPLV